MTKKGTSNLRMLLALIVILIGTFGSVFWGVGIGFSNNFLIWVGRLLLASIPFTVVIIERWIK